jgi:hypothetical protein
MSRLTVQIGIVRIQGGRYKVEKIKVSEDHGDRVDVANVSLKEQAEFRTKDKAREHGGQLAHAFITSNHGEGASYQTQWKTRVVIRQEVVEETVKERQ